MQLFFDLRGTISKTATNHFCPVSLLQTALRWPRLMTCFEPSFTVERAATGLWVVPVTCQLSRSLDKYLAILVCCCQRASSLRISYLKPRQLSVCFLSFLLLWMDLVFLNKRLDVIGLGICIDVRWNPPHPVASTLYQM